MVPSRLDSWRFTTATDAEGSGKCEIAAWEVQSPVVTALLATALPPLPITNTVTTFSTKIPLSRPNSLGLRLK